MDYHESLDIGDNGETDWKPGEAASQVYREHSDNSPTSTPKDH